MPSEQIMSITDSWSTSQKFVAYTETYLEHCCGPSLPAVFLTVLTSDCGSCNAGTFLLVLDMLLAKAYLALLMKSFLFQLFMQRKILKLCGNIE